MSRRQDRPNAILWLVRNHPELKDSQVMRLVGTTKSTIQAIRERTHWNASNLQPMDPVTLGLCSQIDLDLEVHRAAKEKPVDVEAQGATLLPASETTIRPRARARGEEAAPTSSTSMPCSPSSSRSAAQERVATRRRSRASCSRQTNPPVIPGRAEGASPESHNHRRWLWIPGSLAAHPSRLLPTWALKMPISGKPEIGGPGMTPE